jgi:hypothetical protein
VSCALCARCFHNGCTHCRACHADLLFIGIGSDWPELRGAFHCLGLVGLAVAYGMLYVAAESQVRIAQNRYGRVTLSSSVDAWYLQLAMRGCLP